jgi:hypothetical protein
MTAKGREKTDLGVQGTAVSFNQRNTQFGEQIGYLVPFPIVFQ